MARTLRLLIVALAITLVAAACGGSEVSKSDLVDELVNEGLFTREQATCFVDEIWNDIGPLDAEKLNSGELSEQDTAAITAATFTCLDFGDLGDLGDAVGEDTSDFSPDDPPPGDDPELDALWVACGGGDADACDELYFTSEFDTDYETFGFTCGGRGTGECEAVIAAVD